MAEIADPRLIRFIEDLLPVVVRRFQPDRVLAFGSRVRGDALRTSDLDLIVVSRAFQDVPRLERSVQVLEAVGAPFAMDILCYTPEEFERKLTEFGLVRTAARDGVELYRAA